MTKQMILEMTDFEFINEPELQLNYNITQIIDYEFANQISNDDFADGLSIVDLENWPIL